MEPIKQLSQQHFTIALDFAINDDVLNLKSSKNLSPGNYASKLAKQISEKSDVASTQIKVFADHIQGLLLPSVNTHFCPEARQQACTKFSYVTTSESGRKKFHAIIDQLNLKEDGFDILYTFVVTKIFSLILKWKNEIVIKVPEVNYNLVKISVEEEKVLRYVSGFIPFALKKRFSRLKESMLKSAVLQLINTWCVEGECEDATDFYDYTLSWTNRINRGGLMIVKETFFVFIRRIEMTVRGVLNQTLIQLYNGEDLRDMILEELLKSFLIESSWASLSRMLLSEKLKVTMKLIVLKKWVNLRIRSFVTAWIQASTLKQNDKKLSKKAEVSLRKGLSAK